MDRVALDHRYLGQYRRTRQWFRRVRGCCRGEHCWNRSGHLDLGCAGRLGLGPAGPRTAGTVDGRCDSDSRDHGRRSGGLLAHDRPELSNVGHVVGRGWCALGRRVPRIQWPDRRLLGCVRGRCGDADDGRGERDLHLLRDDRSRCRWRRQRGVGVGRRPCERIRVPFGRSWRVAVRRSP